MFQVHRLRFSRAVQLDVNPFQNPFDVGVDVRIPESDDAISLTLEPRLANPISYGCLVFIVMSAVEFDDKARGGTEKIHHIRSDRRLAPKVGAGHGNFF
jgi:hypothetical protein